MSSTILPTTSASAQSKSNLQPTLPKKPVGVVEVAEVEKVKGFKLPSFLEPLGGYAEFSGRFFKEIWGIHREWGEVARHSSSVGIGSIALVGTTGLIMGLVLALQSKPTLEDFGAESMLPSMVSISLVREIAPVITALICAGKIASGFGAELGSMKASEQIDAMEVSAVNPFRYLVVTRVLATTMMVPLLTMYAMALGIFGGWIAINISDYLSFRLFFHQVSISIEFSDLIPAFFKSIVFGFFIGIIGCFKGYYSENGTEGVGKAANSAVVAASFMVFIVDLVVVQLVTLF